MHPLVFIPFIVLGIILGVLAFVLKRKHSEFPDFSVGYHNKKVMENKKKWDYANKVSGNICIIFAATLFVSCALLYCFKAMMAITFTVLFSLSVIAIVCILILPIVLAKRKE